MRRFHVAILVLCCLPVLPSTARADRRYFVHSYTPYLAPAGNLELEATTIAASGQGDSAATAWQNRIEFECGISDRLTGAAYLNFVQPAGEGAPMTFDGPSLELIYRPVDSGRLPVDPAAYLELRANGSEVEIEPKLLLARRIYRLVTAVNVIGEIEPHTAGSQAGSTERSLRVTLGASREIGNVLAVGLEAIVQHEFLDQGPDPTSVLFGPTINLQTPSVQLALGWQPQVSGRPATSGGLNLSDFPRSEIRMIVGVEL